MRIWIIALFIPILEVISQQRTIPTPPQFQQTPQRFANRDQSNSISSEDIDSSSPNLPQPPLFLTSPSFSFDNIALTTTISPTQSISSTRPSFSTRPTRPSQIRRPLVRPVHQVQLQRFRPTPRFTIALPIRPRVRPSASQVRPATQPFLRRIPSSQGQIRPRFQPQPSQSPQRRPAQRPIQRASPPIRVEPASVSPRVQSQTPIRRPQPASTQPALQIRPITQPAVPKAQAFSRAPQPTRPAPSSVPQLTTGSRTRPLPTKPLPPSTPVHLISTATQKRPIPPSTPSFASTNSIGLSGPPPTNRLPSKSHAPGVHPPGSLPPSNSVVDELNHADDFMAVAIRLKLRRFARHRNRRHADFIVEQQMKNL